MLFEWNFECVCSGAGCFEWFERLAVLLPGVPLADRASKAAARTLLASDCS